MSSPETFTSLWLVFFYRHIRIAKSYKFDFASLFCQDCKFLTLTGSSFRFVIPGKPFTSVVNTHVFIIKLIGWAFNTADPEAALADTAVPNENPEPTPTGKYVLQSGTLKFEPDVPNTVPITE